MYYWTSDWLKDSLIPAEIVSLEVSRLRLRNVCNQQQMRSRQQTLIDSQIMDRYISLFEKFPEFISSQIQY